MKREKINEVILCFILLSVFILLVFTIDFKVEADDVKIKNFLTEQGYEVEYIEFTKVEGKGNLYQASKAIDIGVGEPVEYWEIKYYTQGMVHSSYGILPYPYREFPKPVEVKLVFSLAEYETLNKMAGGQRLEDYLKKKILNNK